MNKLKLRKMLEAFLIEDIGDADLTSNAIFPVEQTGKGVFVAKETGIIAGLDIIKEAYHLLDSNIEVVLQLSDGDRVRSGEIIAEVYGPVRDLLTGERVILNLLQRVCGIATITNECVRLLDDPKIQICDTRKTVPGLRMLDKYGVATGGGKNHRIGLFDAVMIKDNHISYAGSITKAVEAVHQSIGHMVKVEVEVETKEEVTEAVQAGVDVIMFDNCSPETVKEFSTLVPRSIVTEASGGINLETLASYKNCGVDYISLGYLTHSVTALDISLQVKEEEKRI